jgi:glycosyltransferase involved in cell wall biosynthesis
MEKIKNNNNNEEIYAFIFILPTWLPTYEFKNIGKLFRFLQLNNFSVTVYCGPTIHEAEFNLTFPEFKIITKRQLYRWPNILGHTRQLIHLYKLLRMHENKKQIFWTYAGYRENLLLLFLKKLYRIHIIIKNDSIILPNNTNYWKKIKLFFTHILPANKADGVISETPEVYNNWKRCINKLTRHVIYSNGADITKLEKCSRIFGEKFNKKDKSILMTGRLNFEKGVDLTVEAFCKIACLYPEWKLTLVGEIYDDKSYTRACELAKQYGVVDRISWIPFCKDLELYEHYYKSEIFINTSRNEGLPNRFVEAMYFKCSVISFDVGQCKYLLSQNRGIIVENGNMELMVEKLMNLIRDDENRKKIGISASEFISNNFNDEINLPNITKWMLGELENERKENGIYKNEN